MGNSWHHDAMGFDLLMAVEKDIIRWDQLRKFMKQIPYVRK
jgi:hypothetical protein